MTESQLYDVLYDWRTEMMCVRLDERVGHCCGLDLVWCCGQEGGDEVVLVNGAVVVS